MFKLCGLYIIVMSRLLEIHFAKCETTITGSTKHNSVERQVETIDPNCEENRTDKTTIIERITRLESSVAEQKLNFERYQNEAKEEVKVLRNATLLLLTLVSGKGNGCQGIKDTASKIKILYAALAAYEPSLNFPGYIEDLFTYPDPEATSTEISTTLHKYDFESNDLESRDLVLQSFNDVSTTTKDITTTTSVPDEYSTTTSNTTTVQTKIYRTTIFPITTLSTPTKTTTTTRRVFSTTTKKPKVYKYKTPTHAPINCPRGSKLVGRECFSVHLDLQLNWTSARTFCRRIGGDLAEPNMGNEKLPRQLLKTWPAFKESSYWTLWVGATDQEKEGEWHWVTGGLLNLNGSPRWNVGEPAEEGETQDCLAMILWVPGRWQRWDLLDDPCDLEWFIFCEYSP